MPCRLLVGRSEAKMPYGELGHVATGNCCCCVGLSSSFGTYIWMYVCIYLYVCWFYAHSFVACLSCTTHIRRTHIYSTGQINPGCGCNSELVEQVVEDLKARQAGRGDPGQIQRQEATLESIRELHRKLDLIMDHLQIERE